MSLKNPKTLRKHLKNLSLTSIIILRKLRVMQKWFSYKKT